jgi:hypothetical protein
MGGATIIPRSPRTTQNEKNFELGKKNFFFSFGNPLYEPILIFSEIRSNNCARDGFKSKSWAKMSTFIPLSLRLSGIKFSLV